MWYVAYPHDILTKISQYPRFHFLWAYTFISSITIKLSSVEKLGTELAIKVR